jgi:hypothetical protein
MRVFACYVVSKLQSHRCPTFGALRFRTNNAQTDSYIFIYIDNVESAHRGNGKQYLKNLLKITCIRRKVFWHLYCLYCFV